MKVQLILELPDSFTGGEQLILKAKEMSVWDMVGAVYPKYERSDAIAEEGDLQKLVDKEYEEGDCADELLSSEYAGDINNPQIKIDWLQANNHILTTTIQAIIDNIVEVKEIP